MLALTNADTVALILLILVALGALVVGYWLFRLVGFVVKAPFVAVRRARPRRPTGLGADYEKLVRSQPSKREVRRALQAQMLHVSSFGYRLASWLSSVVLTVALPVATYELATVFFSNGWALSMGFSELAYWLWSWRRSWRRYAAPPFIVVRSVDPNAIREQQRRCWKS